MRWRNWIGRLLPLRWLQRARQLRGRLRPPAPWATRGYQAWVQSREPDDTELAAQRSQRFESPPQFGVLVPPGEERQETLSSLNEQTYPHWHLIADVSHDVRGDFVTFLAPGDRLAPFALFEIARRIVALPSLDLLYSDEDLIDLRGRRSQPRFSPDWSPETLLARDCIGGLAVIRTSLARELGGLRSEFGESSRHDYFLRLSERSPRVAHVPHVLVHRRRCGTCPIEATRQAVQEAFSRRGLAGVARVDSRGELELVLQPASSPHVTVIIPSRDQPHLLRQAVDSVRSGGYDPFDIVVVENGSRDSRTFDLYRDLQQSGDVRVETWNRPFNFAAINNGVAARSSGELLLFLNNDISADRGDWLRRLVAWTLLPNIGAVGAALYYPNQALQHAGVVIARDAVARHVDERWSGTPILRNVSAVTGACLMMRREVFLRSGGFDEEFAVNFNDVDLCLRVQALGLRVVVVPEVKLRHYESATRGSHYRSEARSWLDQEQARFRAKWFPSGGVEDPYYGPLAEC